MSRRRGTGPRTCSARTQHVPCIYHASSLAVARAQWRTVEVSRVINDFVRAPPRSDPPGVTTHEERHRTQRKLQASPFSVLRIHLSAPHDYCSIASLMSLEIVQEVRHERHRTQASRRHDCCSIASLKSLEIVQEVPNSSHEHRCSSGPEDSG